MCAYICIPTHTPALCYCYRVLKRVGVESPDTAQSEKTLAANVCCELASVSVEDQNKDEGIKLYKEALSHDEGHKKVGFLLTRGFTLCTYMSKCINPYNMYEHVCSHIRGMSLYIYMLQ